MIISEHNQNLSWEDMMQVSTVTYEIKRTLAQYEHELLSVTVTQSVDEDKTGDEMMAEARRVAVSHTTEALRRKREQREQGGR